MGKNICVALNKRNRSESSTLEKHVWQSFYFLAMLDIIVWSSSVCFPVRIWSVPQQMLCFHWFFVNKFFTRYFPLRLYIIWTRCQCSISLWPNCYHIPASITTIMSQYWVVGIFISWSPPYTSYKLVSYLDNTWTIFSLVDRKIRRWFSCL